MAAVAEGVEVWRGGVASWECDEMGHMNVRFYLARAVEGLAGLAAELGMEDAFAPAAVSTLSVREHHARFLREARAGDPLFMTAGVLAIGEDDAVVVQVLRHARSGEPCAAFLTHVAHVFVRENRPFAWSSRTRAAAAALRLEPPSYAQPRGLPGGAVGLTASRSRADELGVPAIGRGVVQPHECDPFGRMRPDAVMGRCSDSAPQFFDRFVSPVEDGRIGRALLEARILYPRSARAGARLELRSGVGEIGERIARFVHWLLDPVDGQPYAAVALLGAGFDLEARKLAPLPTAERAALQAKLIPGLGF